MFRLAVLLAVLAAALPLPASAFLPGSRAEIGLSFAPVVKEAAPAVVNIYARRIVAERLSPFASDPFFSGVFGPPRTVERVQNSLGSGVIVDPGGIVVSNFHVVGGATDIRVVLSDRREFDGSVILADEDSDLAVIRLSGASDLPALDFADSDAAEVGDLVLAIGNPFGVGQTVSSGIVSGLARSGGNIGGRYGYFIQTDAPINPGNSGGALVDMRGALLGINTSILTRSGGSNGIGFAIPANLVAQYVAQAQAGRTEIARPWAGVAVQPVDAAMAGTLGLSPPQGVIVADAHPRSPFLAAGIEPGDVILTLGGQPVEAEAELTFRMTTLGVGTEAEVTYLRGGRRRTATVTLAAAPEDPPRDEIRIETRSSLGGLAIATINPAVIAQTGLPLGAVGVVVTQVSAFAQRTGLRPGDILRQINGQPVETSRDVARIAQAMPRTWEILFERDGRQSLLRLRDR
ncbi:trypsin-like peptidase domain-containing protein [Anianabacter salinae]|uniref:trypsin-like peptidase domain-containing protein n=1 Tax=Anianabacter salinae TaxID=2851023 RepID=UPI00225E3DC6|nr:trypsin-like peptidase domain-containing protein [Anianabacter salinae]MBV0912870.1 trypsin-like peptidase domain-containing protein [Anianabacter salinae]